MDSLHYLHMQLLLEGKSVIGKDAVRQVEIVSDEELPLMLIAQLADQNIIAYFDETLIPGLRAEMVRCYGSLFKH